MKLIDKVKKMLKIDFSRYKRNKQKKFKIPIQKVKMPEEKARKILKWSVVVLSVTAVLGFLRAGNAKDAVGELQAQVETLEKEVASQQDSELYSLELEKYMNEFIPLYMNVPNSQEEFNKRQENLDVYFAENVSDTNAIPASERILTSYEFVDVVEKDGVPTVEVIVNYDIISPAGKTSHSSLLNVPYNQEGETFTVVENPYFTAVPTNKAELAPVDNPYTENDYATPEVAEEVNVFLDDFYAEYASSSAEDMAYIMTNPEGLSGAYEYVSSENNIYNGAEGEIVVKSSVAFKETGTDITHVENFTLKLTKKDDKYYVEEMTHTKGGE